MNPNGVLLIPFIEGLKSGLGYTHQPMSGVDYYDGQSAGFRINEVVRNHSSITLNDLHKRIEELVALIESQQAQIAELREEIAVKDARWGTF